MLFIILLKKSIIQYYNMADASMNFYISGFNCDISSNQLLLVGETPEPFVGKFANVNISLLDFQDNFQWHTDSLMWTEIDGYKPDDQDISFNIVNSSIDFSMNICPLGADDSYGVYVQSGYQINENDIPNQSVGMDYLRRQAYHYFGSTNGVDMFSNENAVLNGLQTDFSTKFKNAMRDNAYNICKSIFDQIANSRSGSFRNIESFGGDDYWYKFDFKEGDTIAFKLTINTDDQQINLTNRPAVSDSYRLAPVVYVINIMLTYNL
jgi:hypothetical protein